MMRETGRSIVAVYTLWERTVRVRFPAPRIKKDTRCGACVVLVL